MKLQLRRSAIETTPAIYTGHTEEGFSVEYESSTLRVEGRLTVAVRTGS
jgi:hypothetical protein